MREQLENILKLSKEELQIADSDSELDAVRVKYLGKKGLLTAILRGMGNLSPEERPVIGALANTVREEVEKYIEERRFLLREKELQDRLASEKLDVTLPAKQKSIGRLHPITQVENRMKEIFLGMGFEIVEGPEIESAYNNFDALNAPPDHPSRDYQDTFYITPDILLRTQTSPVQIRAMKDKKPPIRIISPGRVYRCDQMDATHSPMFHQLEGLVIDKNITMGDLKGTLARFAKSLFGKSTNTRFRPHNFPFTEPSAEVDISCYVCGGEGCRLCKGEGWIEILGAGMVHPNVLSGCGIDPEVYSGFAFGIGIDRVVMRKYNVDNLRLLFDNDIRFLRQF